MSAKRTTKNRARIDEYDPLIYPRKIWVGKNCTLKDIRKRFVRRDGGEIEDQWNPEYNPQTLYVKERETDLYGVLITFPSDKFKQKEYVKYTAHEAEHAKFSIFADTGIESTWVSQEADAYMVGFVAECVWETMFGTK